MKYISTRGRSPEIGFKDVLLSGLAPDGGLYMPVTWPVFGESDFAEIKSMPFDKVAAKVLAEFAADAFSLEKLQTLTNAAYKSFSIAEVAPLVQVGDNDFLLELFHGPTLAFKDVAMQILGQLYGDVLAGRGDKKTIIGATSGDTGGAAIEAFAGIENVDVFMLHPEGRISDVQRRIMTTVDAKNIVNVAVDGSFDDCQRIVKTLFADKALNESHDLGGVNSINWVRLAAQTVYYFTAAQRVPGASYVVPTGNFGDIFAGFVAKKMGANIGKLAVAVNENNIMDRVLKTGDYTPSGTVPTQSPSMDIQVASNFERLIFECQNRDGTLVSDMMTSFERDKTLTLSEELQSKMSQDFVSAFATEEAVSEKMAAIYRDHNMLIDPHTAVGLVANDILRRDGKITGMSVTLATAHPAKFPDAVAAATGSKPRLPQRYHDLHDRKEFMLTAANDVNAIATIIRDHEGAA